MSAVGSANCGMIDKSQTELKQEDEVISDNEQLTERLKLQSSEFLTSTIDAQGVKPTFRVVFWFSRPQFCNRTPNQC